MILALGADGLTTEVQNLKKLPEWAPRLNFALTIMVQHQFPERLHDGNVVDLQHPDGIDLFPPTRHGMRLGIFRLQDVGKGRTRESRELLALWRMIQWGKRSVIPPPSTDFTC